MAYMDANGRTQKAKTDANGRTPNTERKSTRNKAGARIQVWMVTLQKAVNGRGSSYPISTKSPSLGD